MGNLNTWGPAATQVRPAAPVDSTPVRLMIVAQPARAQALNAAFSADARYAVMALATSLADARAKLTTDPEALVVDAVVAAGPADLAHTFMAYPGQAWMLVPENLNTEALDAVRRIECVTQVIEGEPNFATLAGQIYGSVLQRRALMPAQGLLFEGGQVTTTTVGFRSIAVWSTQGGVGKSTVSLALALEARSRQLPVLLIGLAAPDMTPLILDGVKPTPNLLNWQANPTLDGLKAAIQVDPRSKLHMLLGFRETVALGDYNAQEGPASLSNLVLMATKIGYSIIILDVSAPELAPTALSVANTLVLVTRPDRPGVLSAMEGVRTVQDVLAGQHAIPPEAIYLVVNRVRNTTLTPDEVIAKGKAERRDFPPLAAAIADDPNVDAAIGNRNPAYQSSDALRRAMQILGNLLFPAAMLPGPQAAQPAKVKRFGPLKIRTA